MSETKIKGEITSVNTIFRNVIQNDIKYSHNSSKIDVSYTVQEQNMIITIRDYGVGMDKDKVINLFKSSRLTTLGTDNEKGIGLGMLLVKELVHKNSVTIVCKSNP